MSNGKIKKVGAQKGNQNARKHGFYSKTLAPWQQDMVSQVPLNRAFDHDLAVLRARIVSILINDPKNAAVLNRAVVNLTRFLRRNHQYGSAHSRALEELSRIVSQLNARNEHA